MSPTKIRQANDRTIAMSRPSPLAGDTVLDSPSTGVASREESLPLPRVITESPASAVHTSDRSRWQRTYALNLVLTDTLVACGAVVLAHYVRFGDSSGPDGYINNELYVDNYALMYSALSVLIWSLALAGFHTRSPKIIGIGIEEYRRVVAASCWAFGAIAVAALLAKIDVARGYLAIALPVGILGLLLSRCLMRQYLAFKRVRGTHQSAVLAVGEREAVVTLVKELTRNPRDGYRVVGIGIPGYGGPRGDSLTVNGLKIPIFGDQNRILEAINYSHADTVAIAGTDRLGVHGIRRLMWALEPVDVDLYVSPGVMDVAVSRLAIRPIPGIPMLCVAKPQYKGAKRFKKRAFDFCFAIAALTATLPIFLVAAAAVKVSSGGPVFYASERIGIDGRPFRMLKFRTMVEGADKQLADLLSRNECDGLFKIRDDPRITPIGRILRRFSIDELPQFINVLRHDMSVVGPRPPLLREVAAYDGDVHRRLLVKPGITGLWQVSGRSDLSWEESVRLDLSYVDNWSMVGDLVIIARTLGAVLKRKGAY